MSTQSKIALVTGGSRGLGKDMAISIAKKGIDVILTYQSNKTEADKTVAVIEELGRKAVSLQLDMSKPDTLDSFIQELKKLLQSKWSASSFDFLINNAGMGATVPFTEV